MGILPCIICGSHQFESRYQGIRDYEYDMSQDARGFMRCVDCGLLVLDPMPDASELSSFYPPDYANIHEEQVWLHAFLMDRYYGTLHTLFKKELPTQARILDVGCAAGHLIGYLQQRESEWHVLGVDMNPHACEVAAAKGRTVIHSDFESLNLEDGSFDCIILSHLIEHVLDPAVMLLKARKLLKEGGKLYIETPNTKCLDLGLFGKYWGGLHCPRHTYLFSRSNIGRLLGDNGFPEVKIDSTL